MPPILITNPLQLDLPDVGPVAAPIGQPVVQLKCLVVAELNEKQVETGVWEATPGRWRRQITQAELSHFIAGRCTFLPDGGDLLEIGAGDAVFFPPNTLGTWHVLETVRKTYVLFDFS
jgi:uncharacterized cupin superfamily protein